MWQDMLEERPSKEGVWAMRKATAQQCSWPRGIAVLIRSLLVFPREAHQRSLKPAPLNPPH